MFVQKYVVKCRIFVRKSVSLQQMFVQKNVVLYFITDIKNKNYDKRRIDA